MSYQSTEQSNYLNFIVNPSKYLEENQEIHFHHCSQALFIYYYNQDHADININAHDPKENSG